MGRLRAEVVEIVRSRGYRCSDEPFKLASGELSHDFIDGKAACAHGEHLELACRAIIEELGEREIEFDAVGGLTMGADQFAHVIAVLRQKQWFVVRKKRKERGTNQLVEGATLGSGVRVLLVDDVVTTGGSIQMAFWEIEKQGAEVVAAATLVDRGDVAGQFFEEKRIPYVPLVGYRDLNIAPVGGGGLIHA